MLTGNGRDYKDIPHLTEGDEEFRKKFLSWELGDLTYVDIQEYLKIQGYDPGADGQFRAARPTPPDLHRHHYCHRNFLPGIGDDWRIAFPTHLDGLLTAAHA